MHNETNINDDILGLRGRGGERQCTIKDLYQSIRNNNRMYIKSKMRIYHQLLIIVAALVSAGQVGAAFRSQSPLTPSFGYTKLIQRDYNKYIGNLMKLKRESFDHEIFPLQMGDSSDETTTNDDDSTSSWLTNESDQVLLGVAGTIASLVTFYSEYTLKTTGCGLPAGPLGLLGALEGVSYLGVAGVAGFSLFKKVKTGSGLPAGPGGLLGAAEGLSFLAIVIGLIVLTFQILDYGYIPNAVPMEGGMCS